MSKFSAAMIGIVLLLAGLSIGVFVFFNENSKAKPEEVLVKMREGEELLKQNSKQSRRQALSIYNELAAKEVSEDLFLRIKFGQAIALEKNNDKLLALKIYKELVQSQSKIPKDQREKLHYYLGNLLLRLNQEEEARAYLGDVLRNSEDSELKSMALTSIADFFVENKNFEKARENYSLALQEDRYNVHARMGLDKVMQNLGKDASYIDVLPENLEYLYSNHPSTKIKKNSKELVKTTTTGLSYLEKGKTFYLKKEYKKAIPLFVKSIQVTKSSLDKERAYYYISDCYLNIGNFTEALKAADQVLINSHPSLDAAAVFKKGVIYFKKKEYKDAIQQFNDVLEKHPEANSSLLAEKWKTEAMTLLREQANLPEGETSVPKKDDDTEDE